MDTAGLTAEAPSAQPDSSLHCFSLVLRDRDTDDGDSHLDRPLFFSMAATYWQDAPRGSEEFEDTLQELIDEIGENRPYSEYWDLFVECVELPPGSTLPLVLQSTDELKAYLTRAYDRDRSLVL